jgi:hypothetical protein
VAVNVTLVPEQIVDEGEAAMLTLAATTGFTVIVIELEVAGFPVTPERLDVITQVTTWLLVNVVVVYVVLFVPTLTPFTFHW